MVIEVLDEDEVKYVCPECEEEYDNYEDALLCQKKCTRARYQQIVEGRVM